tara:strand:- start:8712 stop:9665 length:954 start_codon:yes stop_codon:yes gene_type:complete
MIPVCNCADGQTIQNFGGFEKCSKGIGIPTSITFNTEETVAGAVNGLILASETPNQAFFDSKYGNQTIEDRWLRLDGIKQYDAPPVDPNTQEFDDGSSYVLNKNSKEVSFVIVTPEANKMLAKVEASVECRGMLASFGDSFDNWVGQSDGVNFTGRKIQDGSFSASVIERTDGSVSQLVIKFKWDRSALESAVDYIAASSMDGYSIKNDTVDLIDARISYGTSLTSGIAFDLHSDVGGALNRLPLGGLTETNLEAYNITDSQVEAGTISEDPIGSYVYTYTVAISTGKDITIRPITNPIQKSYDCKDLTADKFKTSA